MLTIQEIVKRGRPGTWKFMTKGGGDANALLKSKDGKEFNCHYATGEFAWKLKLHSSEPTNNGQTWHYEPVKDTSSPNDKVLLLCATPKLPSAARSIDSAS